MFESTPLKEAYQDAKEQVYKEIGHRQEPSELSELERKQLSKNIPPCIRYVLTELPAKSDKVNFNKLSITLISYFHAAGFSQSGAWEKAEYFVENYSHSETYETPEKRRQHWNSQWNYLEGNSDYRFACSYIKGLGLPGTAFECRLCSVGTKKDNEDTTPDFSSEYILDALQKDEDGDAGIFIDLNRGKFCYDHAAARWYEYKGHFWKEDEIEEVKAAIKGVIEVYANEMKRQSWKWMKALKSKNKEEADEHETNLTLLGKRILALHSDRRKKNILQLVKIGADSLGITGREWDQDPWVLGCQNGVLNLRGGSFRKGIPEDYIKTVVNVQWCGINAPRPTWEKFLKEIFPDNSELIDYVQRLFGYGITGLSMLHIIIILYGIGRNGKGTLLETLKYVLGDLAYKAESELLLDSKFHKQSGAPSSGILALQGKRVIWTSETGQGRKLNAGLIKELVGGDTLSGRQVYGKRHIEFRPTHLLFLLTNHKPYAPGNDFAFWERMHLIPFDISFVASPTKPNERKIDLELPDKLKNESSGILLWLLEGCLKWQKQGLNPPETVLAATKEYQAEEDFIGNFINENCEVAPDIKVQAGKLYGVYKDWCDEYGHEPISGKAFGIDIKSRFDSYTKKYVFYKGVGLKNDH